MKKIISILMLLTLIACNQHSNSNNTFTINGTIKGNIPSYIFVEYGKVRDCTLVKDGKFQLVGSVDKPTKAYLSIPPISSFTDDCFPIENNKIQLEIKVNKRVISQNTISFIKLDTIIGSKTSLVRNDFEKFEKLYKNENDWNNKLNLKLTKLINENPTNFYSSYLLVEQARKGNLTKAQLKILFKKIDTTTLSAKQLESIKNVIFPETVLKKGNQLVDFSLQDVNNKLVSTKNFRGKITINRLADNISFYVDKYGPTGNQAEFGRRSHNAFISALKKFEDFVK